MGMSRIEENDADCDTDEDCGDIETDESGAIIEEIATVADEASEEAKEETEE